MKQEYNERVLCPHTHTIYSTRCPIHVDPNLVGHPIPKMAWLKKKGDGVCRKSIPI
jgi:hypothetical protein